ncbi:hypothetical protein LCGC14_0838970 [marine sediment metagenome]|uniref:Uncharacterized protein n=1 Tax=marine sediment metagenome TaxID=412755 RepID=A0A0F9SL16_9ZZZZ
MGFKCSLILSCGIGFWTLKLVTKVKVKNNHIIWILIKGECMRIILINQKKVEKSLRKIALNEFKVKRMLYE